MLVLFIVLTFVFAASTYFFFSEGMRKFGFMQEFIQGSNQLIRWNYPGAGNRDSGMRNIVLCGNRPFSVLIGFRLTVFGRSGFDYYGCVHSNAEGVAVISTYLGKGACEFLFLSNADQELLQIVVSCTEEDLALKPSVVYPPHWFQRLGIFG